MTAADPHAAPTAAAVPDLAARWDAERRLDLARLSPDDRAAAERIAAELPALDGAAVNGFGADTQTRANSFLDELLDGIRTADAGVSGRLLAELASGVKALDIPGLRREAEGRGTALVRIAGDLPVVGRYVSAFTRFRADYRLVIDQFSDIEKRGRIEMGRLAAMDSRMDKLVAENLRSLRELEVQVAAGQIVLDRERARFARERRDALRSRDPSALAAVRDFGEQINGFETRLLRLAVAMGDAMLSVPQTRNAQTAGRIEYRNILDTLLFDLPRLKSAILRIAALKSITDASKASEARRRLAQQMNVAGVDALEAAYLRAKESEGGALGEVAAMGEIADRIIGMIDRGAAIDARNRAERAEAQLALEGTKKRYVDGLAAAGERAVQAERPA
ncbi:toxic anion resistance protein [Lichenibacterium dinghuense]|uniref:toxic anion resistance protein n=1 Tax=Lichenibacterium dinghuense TaxID=2895977 RepID=UPI001F230974|nr:toxic anion resistance protein [Lichenibacterium sp. 6Y81]